MECTHACKCIHMKRRGIALFLSHVLGYIMRFQCFRVIFCNFLLKIYHIIFILIIKFYNNLTLPLCAKGAVWNMSDLGNSLDIILLHWLFFTTLTSATIRSGFFQQRAEYMDGDQVTIERSSDNEEEDDTITKYAAWKLQAT